MQIIHWMVVFYFDYAYLIRLGDVTKSTIWPLPLNPFANIQTPTTSTFFNRLRQNWYQNSWFIEIFHIKHSNHQGCQYFRFYEQFKFHAQLIWAWKELITWAHVLTLRQYLYCGFIQIPKLSQCMRFPTMWYVRPAKPQISLRIHTVWSEPLLVAWVFYDCNATNWTPFGVSKLKRGLQRLVRVYTCQNVKLLEISCCGSNVYIAVFHITGNELFFWQTDFHGLFEDISLLFWHQNLSIEFSEPY